MKSIRPVQISGIGCYVPERVLTNHDLSKIVDTSDEWILQRTGISERRIVDKGKATSDMAEQAVRRLCASLQMDPNEIELLIVATVTPDMFFPSTACLLQEKLGIKQTWGFDLSAACCGFVYSLSVGAAFVAAGLHSKVVVVGSDTMSSIIDYQDRATCVIFGDGAGAVLLEPAKKTGELSHRFSSRSGWLGRCAFEDASRRKSPSLKLRNGEEPSALRKARRSCSVQVCDPQNGGSQPDHPPEEPTDSPGHSLVASTPS